MKYILYLASGSQSRKKLLEMAGIPFQILSQTADETACDWGLPLQKLVQSIACHKMDHVQLPIGKENETIFVLTADTLSIDTTGAIRGKPTDWDNARAMLKAACGPNNYCGTAFCLDKKIYANNQWQVSNRIIGYAQAQYEFEIPESWIDNYIQRVGALQAAGAIKIEQGAEFIKNIYGSYTAVVGLPMFELRQALTELKFFEE